MYTSTEDGSFLPVIGFSLKGAIITSDFVSSLLGKREQQETEEEKSWKRKGDDGVWAGQFR